MPRIGRKRNDLRYRAEDGSEWASKFEWEIYDYLSRSGALVRRCDSSDTLSYVERKPNVQCLSCGGSECVQTRTYTPDLFLIPQTGTPNTGGYYIEAKGYFRPEKRKLFRCFVQNRPDIALRVVFSADHWVTRGKSRVSDYFNRYLKNTPYHIWDGGLPEDWL